MVYEKKKGVPRFICREYQKKTNGYCVLIPIINEGKRIHRELNRAVRYHVSEVVDIVICDGGSDDNSTNDTILKRYGVNTLLIKDDCGKQGAQLRMGIWWAIKRGYKGIITIDGNNKDSIEDVPSFIAKLEAGYDLVQGSRFIRGGHAVRTPVMRLLAVRCIHAPIISLTARHLFTDTTNAYRGYSIRYLMDPRVGIFRDIFASYELLAYLSVRATQLGYRACEIPVARVYPKDGNVPTKISFYKGNKELIKILLLNLFGYYNPSGGNATYR